MPILNSLPYSEERLVNILLVHSHVRYFSTNSKDIKKDKIKTLNHSIEKKIRRYNPKIQDMSERKNTEHVKHITLFILADFPKTLRPQLETVFSEFSVTDKKIKKIIFDPFLLYKKNPPYTRERTISLTYRTQEEKELYENIRQAFVEWSDYLNKLLEHLAEAEKHTHILLSDTEEYHEKKENQNKASDASLGSHQIGSQPEETGAATDGLQKSIGKEPGSKGFTYLSKEHLHAKKTTEILSNCKFEPLTFKYSLTSNEFIWSTIKKVIPPHTKEGVELQLNETIKSDIIHDSIPENLFDAPDAIFINTDKQFLLHLLNTSSSKKETDKEFQENVAQTVDNQPQENVELPTVDNQPQ
jgi:hypothetical protein